MPAMPTVAEINRADGKFYESQIDNDKFMLFGLTKREHFAGLAMQAILSSMYVSEFNGSAVDRNKLLTKRAVDYADALIKELEGK